MWFDVMCRHKIASVYGVIRVMMAYITKVYGRIRKG